MRTATWDCKVIILLFVISTYFPRSGTSLVHQPDSHILEGSLWGVVQKTTLKTHHYFPHKQLHRKHLHKIFHYNFHKWHLRPWIYRVLLFIIVTVKKRRRYMIPAKCYLFGVAFSTMIRMSNIRVSPLSPCGPLGPCEPLSPRSPLFPLSPLYLSFLSSSRSWKPQFQKWLDSFFRK